ncbi:linear amide C-N hydrolase [Mobilitalea sibirica]|uniref:Linear amide C-N hydrolase n=1 Tax=Mobilitalea sibirica TaxID=1462919 RepID=A0A8J7H968_9FIRM|nr:linear amide C-N hydrolase [Mobilitalea sibirica]MBH1940835.1 linear amide C-N hydrolase [Mobilitalea sibirica]
MCTVFKLNNTREGNFYVGKNYDAPDPCQIMIFINNAGIEKQALIKGPEVPVRWEVTYGSITFNQLCRDFPCSGMNEAGLIVEQTTLWNTIYPDRDERPAVKELQWIQLMLDTCATTNEVIAKSKEVRISQSAANLQYFICDSSGDVCLIEFIMGEMHLYRGDDLVYPVIANDMYETSLDYLKIHEGYGGHRKIAASDLSLDRFAVTVDAICRQQMNPSIDTCDSILSLSAFSLTQWSVIYDTANQCISYKSKNSTNIKHINFSEYDFHHLEVPLIKMLDTDEHDFINFTVEKNYELLKFFYSESQYFKNLKISEDEIKSQAGF